MSRLYNPAIFSYRKMLEDVKREEPKKQTSGLLTPTNNMQKSNPEDDLSQPALRVKKHFDQIKERRNNINGN